MSYAVGIAIAIGLPVTLGLLLRLEDTQFLAVVIVSELIAFWVFTKIKRAEKSRRPS